MLKKSFIIVFIQVVGIFAGFASVYLVAGDMAPEVYSLVGVYGIVNSIFQTFSNLGVETTMMREALYWKQNDDNEKIVEYTTQAILSRIIGFTFLFPLVLIYLFYLDYAKYDGSNMLLFFSFCIGAFISALDDSISLIIRSLGGFVFAQFAQTLNNNILKLVAILVYVLYGAQAYLYFYALYSLPLLIIFIVKVKSYFSFRYVVVRSTIRKIKEARFLFMRSYLDYFRAYADTIIVSLLFPSRILGSYSLFKSLEGMVRNFEDGFFDVMVQNVVKYKGDFKSIKRVERSYNYARMAVMVFIMICMVIFSTDIDYFIHLVNLSHYDGIVYILYCLGIFAIVNLAGKYEISALSLLATSKFNFKFGFLTFVISILSYAVLVLLPSLEGMLLQRIVLTALISMTGMFFFYRGRGYYYTRILK